MRFVLTFLALLVMAVPSAQATEDRIMVTDIHNFVAHANSAINNPNMNVGRNFLNRTTAENAIFENRVAVYTPADPWHRVWYNNPAYGYNYRYPLNPYYNPTSMRNLGKWNHINMLESKKRMIPGYRAEMEITNTVISPYGGTAIVDVDMREWSLAYTPYHPTLSQQVLNANSKCKLYLSKMGDHDVVLSRMDCNTNTNLPF